MWVVAGGLKRPGGQWLLHRRPLEKHHGGLWEFPGGKVEGAEFPVKALIRELHEELGITVSEAHCTPTLFAEDRVADGTRGIVLLLYTVIRWQGEPQALEGGAIEWFEPSEIAALPKPPLDSELAAKLFEKPR